MFKTVKALVLRYAEYRENSRMLTLLTEDGERVDASAHGRRAYMEPFVCVELTLRERGGRYAVTEGRTLSEFRGIRADLEKFELAADICRLLEQLSASDAPEPLLYKLGVRTLLTLSTVDAAKIVALRDAFETRAARLSGFGNVEEMMKMLEL